MDSYTKIVLTIIAFSTSVLALQSFLKDKTIELQQNNQLQRITLCTASGDCGVGTHFNAPFIIDNRSEEPHLYQVPDSFRY